MITRATRSPSAAKDAMEIPASAPFPARVPAREGASPPRIAPHAASTPALSDAPADAGTEAILARVVWRAPGLELHAIVALDAHSGDHCLRLERVDRTEPIGRSENAPDSIDRARRASVLSNHPAHNARVEITRSPTGDWLHADAPGLFAASFRREHGAWTIAYARLAGIGVSCQVGMSRGTYEMLAPTAELTRVD